MSALSHAERTFLLDNPDVFIATYFGDAIDQMEDFHLRLIRTATEEPRGLILYPAAHGKTTLVSTLLPIWAACRDPNTRMAVIAKNDEEAKRISRSISAEMMDNDDLIRDWGPFIPEGDDTKPWSLQAISIAARTLRAKEPTIAFFGAQSRGTLGHRADWVICDDVITEKNSSTPEQRNNVRQWFNQSVQTMGRLPTSRLTVVGTLFDPSDLYCDLIEMCNPEDGRPIWHVQREDAIVDEEEHLTLWPGRWPWKRLMELKAQMGTIDFNKRLRNIAVDKSRMVFKEEYVKGGWIGKQEYPGCVDRTHVVGGYDPAWRRVCAIDPAVGHLSRTAKFVAHIVLGLGSCPDHERCIWVIDLHRDQMTLPQQVDLILERHERYDVFMSIIEANSYQMGLHQAVVQKMDEQGLAYRVEPHYTTRTNKPDPETGVQSMVRWFENGWVHIPQGNPESRRKMVQLIDELVQYPGRTTDTVMAFWIAWRALQVAAPKYQCTNRLAKKPFWGRKVAGRKTVRNPYYEVPEAA